MHFGAHSGVNPLKFEQTVKHGHAFEEEVAAVLKAYSRHVYGNVKIDTRMTDLGYTEVDIVAAISDYIFIVEVKNASYIKGSLGGDTWEMKGAQSGQTYHSMNIFMQNRLHCEALQQAWLDHFYEASGKECQLSDITIPQLVPIVVVRNTTTVDEELREHGIFTLHELSTQLPQLAFNTEAKFGYQLDYLIGENNHIVRNFGK